MHFDGYLDISVVSAVASKWGSTNYWIFEPKSGRFVINMFAEALNSITHNGMIFDPEAQEIRSFHCSETPPCEQDQRAYKLLRDSLVLVETVMNVQRGDHCVAERRRLENGRMRLIETRIYPVPRNGSHVR